MFVSVGLIHPSADLIPLLTEVAREVMADVDLLHMVDDGMLRLIEDAGELTEPVTRRVCTCALNAQEAGAEGVMLTSPVIGCAADAARALVRIPVVRIDDAMAQTAVQFGRSVGVLASRDLTLQATLSLLREHADAQGRDVALEPRLCEQADRASRGGDLDAYNRIISEEIEALSGNEMIVLADVAMHRASYALNERVQVPVLASPRHGFEDLAKKLNYFRR